jgi:hypothetical protein
MNRFRVKYGNEIREDIQYFNDIFSTGYDDVISKLKILRDMEG